MAFSQILAISLANIFRSKTKHQKKIDFFNFSRLQTYQISTNDVQIFILCLSYSFFTVPINIENAYDQITLLQFLCSCSLMYRQRSLSSTNAGVPKFRHYGGFQLQDLIISRIIDHVTCYKFEYSHWLKYSLQSQYCNFN